jgi:hypothetical protein
VIAAFKAAGAELLLTLSQVFPPADLDAFGTYQHSRLQAAAAAESRAAAGKGIGSTEEGPTPNSGAGYGATAASVVGDTGGGNGSAGISAAAEASHALAVDMRFGAVDQLVCSAAVSFVGNLWSSFSHHFCYLRQLRAQAEGRPRGAVCEGADVYGRAIDPRMPFI